MVFSSIPFLFFFLPIFFLLYFIVPTKWKNYVLLIFSLLFYAWGEPIYVLLMIFSCFINYLFALKIEANEKNEKRRKTYFILSLVINLALLGFFKYVDFFIENINTLLRLDIPLLELGLPIGISFFTFQAMSYTIDVYRKDVKTEKNFFLFTTYVSMFPQLIAGPIVRYETVNEEIHDRKTSFSNFSSGLCRFMRGLFKKVLLANTIGYLFNIISTSSLTSISLMTSWLGILAFALQIYFDFSGYSDMAIGLGLMMGFHYLENFNYPYIAKSITDFWRRWHISLSTWFKDYVYIPLGGNRVSKIKHIRNIMIVWMLTGFWHGSAWNFILWGLYFGILLLLEKYVLSKYLNKLPHWLQHIYSLFFIAISWLLFAFDDMNTLGHYAKIMFGFSGQAWIDKNFIFYIFNYGLLLLIGILLSTPVIENMKKHIKKKHNGIASAMTILVYLILFLITISYLVSDTYNPFLYFRF